MLTRLYLSFLVNYQLESTYKKAPFIQGGIFSDVILVSNYHGYKEEVINLIPHYLIDIIYKIVEPSHLEKLQSYQMEISHLHIF